MSTEINGIDTKQNIEVDAEKRAFMKKFGKYAAVGAGMSVLMGPGVSKANAYDCNSGKTPCTDGGDNGIINGGNPK